MTNAAAGPAARARVAVGGEAGILLVPRQHVAQAARLEPAVQLDVVHAGDAERGVDAVGGERLDDVAADCPGSCAHALEMLAPPTHSKLREVLVPRGPHQSATAPTPGSRTTRRSRRASAARTSSSSASATPTSIPRRRFSSAPSSSCARRHALRRGGRARWRCAQAIARAHAARTGQSVERRERRVSRRSAERAVRRLVVPRRSRGRGRHLRAHVSDLPGDARSRRRAPGARAGGRRAAPRHGGARGARDEPHARDRLGESQQSERRRLQRGGARGHRRAGAPPRSVADRRTRSTRVSPPGAACRASPRACPSAW